MLLRAASPCGGAAVPIRAAMHSSNTHNVSISCVPSMMLCWFPFDKASWDVACCAALCCAGHTCV